MDRCEFNGTPVSEGFGQGEIFLFQLGDQEIKKGYIKEAQVEEEIKKLDSAVHNTLCELDDLGDSLRIRLETQGNLIFNAYKAVLEDGFFIQEIKDLVREKRCFAENAVYTCIDGYVNLIRDSGNEYAAQGIFDLRDIGDRIIRNINGSCKMNLTLDMVSGKKIVAVRYLTTWLAAALAKKKAAGIVAEEGAGFFSHAAIILRNLGIPAVNNVLFDSLKQYKGLAAAINGSTGNLVINPLRKEIVKGKKEFRQSRKLKEVFTNLKSETTDGHKIKLMANINSIDDCERARYNKADGIGLVRTELLFLDFGQVPDERQQIEVYSKIIKKCGNKQVAFRTLDAGGDKILEFCSKKHLKNFENLRGIDLFLENRSYLVLQLKALIKAAQNASLSIMFPMVEKAGQIEEAREIISKLVLSFEAEEEKTSKKFDIGAVIESKRGIENLEEIINKADFISLGTNDLLQDLLGVSRKNLNKMEAAYLDKNFIGILKYCIDTAKQYNKPISVCGEMASDTIGLILLIGLGFRSFSLNPSKIKSLGKTVSKISASGAVRLAERVIEDPDVINKADIYNRYLESL